MVSTRKYSGEFRVPLRHHREKALERKTPRSLTRLAREGATHGEWLEAAVTRLLTMAGVDRAGAWLKDGAGEASESGQQIVLRGGLREAEDAIASTEWVRLPLGSHLPLDLLASGYSFAFCARRDARESVFGPAMGMLQGVWIPVIAGASLRGLLLVAAQDAEPRLSYAIAEDVATELGLALEWEERDRLANQRKADLDLEAEVETQLGAEGPADAILQKLTELCTAKEEPAGLGAAFALIGVHAREYGMEAPSEAALAERLEVRALSGESAWGHSVERGPLEMFWRRAVETGEAVEAKPEPLPLARDMARIMALPLAYDGAVHGVLIAGLRHENASLEGRERLEHRARLATRILQNQERLAERERTESWRRMLLKSSERPVLLLDRRGFIRGASRGATELLGQEAALTICGARAELRFAELFRPRDWERADRWFRETLATPEVAAEPEGALHLELKNGTPVQGRFLRLDAGEFVALSLDPAPRHAPERTREDVEIELRQTVGWMEEGVALFDETGCVRAANERFHRMLGLSAGEAAEARTLEDLLRLAAPHARDPAAFARAWRELADSADGESQEELQMSWPVAADAGAFCARDYRGKWAAAGARRSLPRDDRAADVSIANGANRETCFDGAARQQHCP